MGYQTAWVHSEDAGLAWPLGIPQPLRATLEDLFAGCLSLQLQGLVLRVTSNTSQETAMGPNSASSLLFRIVGGDT